MRSVPPQNVHGIRDRPINEEATWPSQLLSPTLASKQTQDKQLSLSFSLDSDSEKPGEVSEDE